MTHFLFFFFVSTNLFAQNYKQFAIQNQKVYADVFQNLYIQQKHSLIKLDTTGTMLYSYTNSFLGNIHSVDVSNPFKIIAFHNETNHVVFLSNTLVPLGNPISLDNLGYVSVKIICTAETEGFWIYDDIKMQQILINNQLNPIFQGTVLLLENPTNILAKNNSIYIGSKNNGIYEFDYSGNLKQFVPIKELNYFQLLNDKIVYATTNKIFIESKEIVTFDKEIQNFTLLKNSIICSFPDSIVFVYLY